MLGENPVEPVQQIELIRGRRPGLVIEAAARDPEQRALPAYGQPRVRRDHRPPLSSREMAGCPARKSRIRRLMRKLGLSAIRPKRNTSKPHPEHKVYPYLLRDRTIDQPNQVWANDITYIPMRRGFLYLVAIMDWATRRVLSWRLSNTLS